MKRQRPHYACATTTCRCWAPSPRRGYDLCRRCLRRLLTQLRVAQVASARTREVAL